MMKSFSTGLFFSIIVTLCLTAFAHGNLRRASATSSSYHVEEPVVYYPAKYVLPANAAKAGIQPPMEVATTENMDPELQRLGIDFTGIWWMSDNPVPEELVSFANTKVSLTNGGFPATLMVPNGRKGMWSWLTSFVGSILRKYYGTSDPNSHTDFVFESSTKGKISTGLTDVPLVWVESFPFYKYTQDCDETSGSKDNCDPTDCAPKDYDGTCADLIEQYPDDMWSRPTKFQAGSIFSDTTYTLKRIVMGDGTPHPVFWNEFMEHMKSEERQECHWSWFERICETIPAVPGEKQLQSYMSDDWCARRDAAIWGLGSFGC
jgi:hypothetical protein